MSAFKSVFGGAMGCFVAAVLIVSLPIGCMMAITIAKNAAIKKHELEQQQNAAAGGEPEHIENASGATDDQSTKPTDQTP